MTDQKAFDQLLKESLDDYRLSRGERQSLAARLKEMTPDARELAVLRSRAFKMARECLERAEDKSVIEWIEDVSKLLLPQTSGSNSQQPDEALFSPEDDCVQRIVGLLGSTREKVEICVFTITDDRISQAILDAHRRGVAVRIITDNQKAEDRGSDIDRLEAAGIPVRVDRTEYHMHHKFSLFDGARVLTGSYNWTRGAASYNQENLIVSCNDRLVRRFSEAFERLWRALG